ncbi:hypothetical protein HDU93_003098 [Gonapodya sp. JEL0774]|nr:hypothetical protein HDU93_003098 [Gonapodya sp. JEL0774]
MNPALTTLTETLRELEAAVADRRRAIRELEQRAMRGTGVGARESANKMLEQEADSLRRLVEEKELEVQRTREEIEKLQMDGENVVRNLQKEAQKDMEREIASMMERYEARLKAAYDASAEGISDPAVTVQALTHRIAEIEVALAERDRFIKETLEQRESGSKEVHAKFSTSTGPGDPYAYDASVSRVSELTRRIAVLESELSDRESDISELMLLRTRCISLEQNLADLRSRSAQMEIHVDEVTRDLDEEADRVDGLEAQVKEIGETIRQSMAEGLNGAATFNSPDVNDEADDTRLGSEQGVQPVAPQLGKALANVENMNRRIEKLESDILEARRSVVESDAHIKSAELKNCRYQALVLELRKSIADLQESLNIKSIQICEQEAQLTQAREIIVEAVAETAWRGSGIENISSVDIVPAVATLRDQIREMQAKIRDQHLSMADSARREGQLAEQRQVSDKLVEEGRKTITHLESKLLKAEFLSKHLSETLEQDRSASSVVLEELRLAKLKVQELERNDSQQRIWLNTIAAEIHEETETLKRFVALAGNLISQDGNDFGTDDEVCTKRNRIQFTSPSHTLFLSESSLISWAR